MRFQHKQCTWENSWIHFWAQHVGFTVSNHLCSKCLPSKGIVMHRHTNAHTHARGTCTLLYLDVSLIPEKSESLSFELKNQHWATCLCSCCLIQWHAVRLMTGGSSESDLLVRISKENHWMRWCVQMFNTIQTQSYYIGMYKRKEKKETTHTHIHKTLLLLSPLQASCTNHWVMKTQWAGSQN